MNPSPHASRQAWLACLAQAPRSSLAPQGRRLMEDYRFEVLRAPEAGLLMLRARASNSGQRFNFSEATLSRCALRYRPAVGPVTVGLGHLLGRDLERVQWIAAADALLQQPELAPLLQRELIAPLQQALAVQRAAEAARVAPSRVQFYTLQAEAV